MVNGEQKLTAEFSKLWYGRGALQIVVDKGVASTDGTMNAYYHGYLIQKNPMDMWIYQELLWECEPDLIIEFGTASGASALFMADELDKKHAGAKGTVVSVDIDNRLATVPSHKRIHYCVADTEDVNLLPALEQFRDNIDAKKVMLILDDAHGADHVLYELLLYSHLVTKGQYLIVEDTNVDYPLEMGEGPGLAVKKFLERNKDFEVDEKREKFLMTHNPGGYLRRI